jgi:hypothetical protein
MYIVANWRMLAFYIITDITNTSVFYIDSNYVKANLRLIVTSVAIM